MTLVLICALEAQLCHNGDMNDPRIVIPRGLRNLGFLVGFAMIAAGLIIGWIRSGHDVQLPPTGWKGGRS